MLGRGGYAAGILRQLTARKLRLQQQRLGIDAISVQVAQGLTGGDAARPEKRTVRDLALQDASHSRSSRRVYQEIGLIYQDPQKERNHLSDCWRRLHPAA